MIVESDGLQWIIEEGAHDNLGPDHETALTPLVLGLLPEGGTFLDVGAHVGHYALRASFKAGKVIAVEANPDTAAHLRRNIAFNGLRNVHVLELAAWDGVGRFSIRRVHEQYERDGSSRVIPDPAGPVWGARLDDALSRYPLRPDRLDLVKIDAEGADLHVISGMQDLLERHRPVLFIEDHSVYGYYEQADLLALLDYLSYEPEPAGPEPGWWLARPSPAPCAVPVPG